VSTFVVAYASDGKPIWNRVFDGSGENIPMAVAIDAAGDAIVAGRMSSSIVVDGTSVTGGPNSGYLFDLDSSGKALFATHLANAPSGLAVDGDRNILFVSDGVTKLDPSGKPLWTRGGSASNSYWFSQRAAVAVDTGGNALVTGLVGAQQIDFDTVEVQVGDGQPTFVANIGP
jgi:hypothetical protein